MSDTITAPAIVELACITNTPHERLAYVNQRACTYKPVTEDGEEVPRRATHGFLCSSCWHKLLAALQLVPTVVMHLRSTDTGGQGMTERVQSSMAWQLPIPASWMAADDIMAALGETFIPTTASLDETRELVRDALTVWASPERVVATADGAVRAVALYRWVQTALARWPEADADRPMPAPLRCPNCQQLALWYRAPLDYLDDLEVTCGSCGHVQDWDTFTQWTQTFTDAYEQEQKAEARRVRAAKRKATA